MIRKRNQLDNVCLFVGPYSRTPESRLFELIQGGLTTVVGILGTDGVTRR